MKNIFLVGLLLLMLAIYVKAENLQYNPTDVATFEATGQCQNCNLSSYTARVNSAWESAVNVSGSNITNSQIGTTGGGNWRSANFSGTLASFTQFNGIFYFANFNSGLFYYPKFKGVYSVATFNNESSMIHADFSNAQIDGGKFINTNLTNANFKNAKVDVVDFINTNLTGANFFNASLTGVNFDGATVTSATNLQCANILGAINMDYPESVSSTLPNTACMVNSIGERLPPPSGYASCTQLCPSQ